MHRKFADQRTERVANGVHVPAFTAFERTAERRIGFLLEALSLRNIGAIPGLRLEKLQGDRQGQWSIRINDQRYDLELARMEAGDVIEREVTPRVEAA